jgi:hypothetical protein
MTATRQRRRLKALILLAALLPGCNFSSIPYFLGFGDDTQPPGEMRLVSSDKKKEVKVIILAYAPLDTRPEFVTVDRELSGLLTRQLQQSCKENKEKVSFVAASKIQDYKNNHPDWHTMRPEDIGRHFKADYVISLEIGSISLYERGSANQLYRGRAKISVTLFNLQEPDNDPLEKEFTCEYPAARGPIPADDKDARQFYLEFLNYVAQRLSWYFTAHPFRDETCD